MKIARVPVGISRSQDPSMASVYIILRPRGGIKVGYSAKPPSRLYELRQATPDRLELLWEADFGDLASSIEATTKKLLRPWRIRGEWFDTSPLMAGLAIECARDGSDRIESFLARMARCHQCRPDYLAEERLEAEVERDFPDIYPRIAPLVPGTWTDWTGKKHALPATKFTRVMVSGLPETSYGCPGKPGHVAAGERVAAEIRARREGKKLRLNAT